MTERPSSGGAPDPIRAPKTIDVGNKGEAAAINAFAQIDWPATPTTAAQDLGTDMLIAARDRRFHRGEFLGAQVKSGESSRGSPVVGDDGEHLGWWVNVEARHANYWVDNAIGHVLVLYDETTDLCHWVHLNETTIISTGIGRKIQVPVAQVVCLEQVNDLLAVAATARPEVPLEGTAWTGAAPKAPTDHLRYALVAPRLIAPHPNSGLQPGAPADAVALLMQARIDDVWPFGEPHDLVPSRAAAATHETWAWRFVAALADWLTIEDDSDPFDALRSQAPSAHERAAVTAVMAHRLLAEGEPEAARALLQDEIDADEVAPVDHAWLHLHLARAHHELADLDEARRAATLSLAAGATQRHDVTATAIRGVAAAVLFDTSRFGDHDLANTIRYNDTAIAWWRSRSAYTGTVAFVETAFDRAVGHRPSAHDGIQANNQVFAASVQAGILGSHGQWRHYSGLLARQELIDSDVADADALTRALGALRRAGADRPVSRATWWVSSHGPADAVAAATRGVDLTRSTSSSIVADLAMLRVAADIVDEPTASAAADWLGDALQDPARLRALTHHMGYDPQQWIAEHLAGIFTAIPHIGAERTVDAIERYADDFGVLAARSWANVLTAIPQWAWTAEQAARLTAVPSVVTEDVLAVAVAVVAQSFDPAARTTLLDHIRAGRLWVLDYIHKLDALTSREIDEVRDLHMTQVDKDCAAERDGTLARGRSRPLDGLAALALGRDGDAAWDVVERVLADPAMPAWYKTHAIGRMANDRDLIGDARRVTLSRAISAAAQAPPSVRWRGGDADLTGLATFAGAVLQGSDADASHIVSLAAGGIADRQRAARLARSLADLTSLSILATDRSPFVRGEAAYGLARAVAEGASDARTTLTLQRVVADRGRTTGIAVAQVIGNEADVAALSEVRDLLMDHPSAEVRRLVRSDDCGATGDGDQ